MPTVVSAQTVGINPGCPAGFGVDGDIQANLFSNMADSCMSTGTDDWLNYGMGTGIGVINESDALLPSPCEFITENVGNVCVRQDESASSNFDVTLIDAIYAKDQYSFANNTDGSAFQQGNQQNYFNPQADWDAGPGNVPSKDEIIDAFAHLRSDNLDNVWFIGAASLYSSNGNAHLDFELYREAIGVDNDNEEWISDGEDYGRTAWNFTVSGGIATVADDGYGDILFSFDFINGGTILAQVDQNIGLWMTEAQYLSEVGGDGGVIKIGSSTNLGLEALEFHHLDEAGNPSDFGYARFAVADPNEGRSSIFTAVNIMDVQAPCWGTWIDDYGLNNMYKLGHFSEIGVNLSEFGVLDPSGAVNQCGGGFFNTLVIKTRSSASGGYQAELKDYVKPVGFGIGDTSTVTCEVTRNIDCENTTGELTASVTGNFEIGVDIQIDWYKDGVLVGSGIPFETEENACGVYMAKSILIESGCVLDSTTCEVICDNTPPDLTCTKEDITCFGDDDGSASVSAIPASLTYTYAWTGPDGYTANTASISNLAPGTYEVTVTETRNGCYSTCSVTVVEPPALRFQDDLIISGFSCCPGPPSGQVCFEVRGGTPPYDVTLNPGNITMNDLPGGLIPICFDGLSPNVDYTIVVLDAQNCAIDTLFDEVVEDPQPPSIDTSICCGSYNLCCFGDEDGFIHLGDAVGCSGTVTYTWTGPGGFTSSSQNIDGLGAGTYCVVVEDDCIVLMDECFTIDAPPAVTCTIDAVQYACDYNVRCNGYQDGEITVTGAGGCPPYTFSIDGGANFQSSNVFSNLGAGSYSVITKDSEDCTGTCSITLNEPDPLSCQASYTPKACGYGVSCAGYSDGQITVTGDGGCGPYEYSLDVGPYQASGTFNNVSAGPHTVTIRDANGCTSTCNVDLPEPDPLTCSLNVTNDGCVPGTACDIATAAMITVTANGGCDDPYQYSLNGGPFQNSNVFGGLAPNSYTVTVRDANGCETTCSTTIQEIPPLACESITAITYNCGYNVSCFGASDGQITAVGSGGCPPYTYSLNGGTGQASGVFPGLSAGTYTVTITDIKGCVATCSITLNQPTEVSCSITKVPKGCGYDVSCHDGSDGQITVTGNGGCAPYMFKIGGGAYQASGSFGGLSPGSYTVTVKDANNCTSTCSVTIDNPPLLTCSLSADEYDCGYNVAACRNDGEIVASGSGGCPPYEYSIGGPFQGSGIFDDLAAGPYTVTIRDANGCTSTCSITLTKAPPLSCSIEAEEYECDYNVSCYGAADGEIAVTGAGGCPPYSFTLGATTNGTGIFTGLSAGLHMVTITDDNGCQSTCSIELTQPDPLTCNLSAKEYECDYNVSCYGASDGEITVNGNGGCEPYMYKLDGGAFGNSNLFTGLTAGSYVVTIKDANGCESTCTTELTQPDPLTCSLSAKEYECDYNVSCNGAADGEITVNGNGGCEPYMYSLDGGAFGNSNLFTGLTAGSYEVTIKDANGCESTCEITLNEPDPLQCDIIEPAQDISCGSEGNILTSSVSGGCDDPYTYAWTVASDDDSWVITGGANTAAVTYTAGTQGVSAVFTLTVTDANGCETTCEIEVECVGGDIFCTFTQGYYGNPGGLHCDGSGTFELIDSFLRRDGYLLLGDSAAGNSIVFFEDDAQCIIDRLPGGGPPKALTGNGSCDNPQAAGVAVHNNTGRFRNVLLAQTLTLALNLRLDPGLASLEFADSFAVIMSTDDCGGDDDAEPNPGTEHYVAVPVSWIGHTVADVFEAANAALAGTVPQPELRDLAINLGWINETFDECVFLAGWLSDLPPIARCQDITVSADENCEGTGSIDNGSYDPDGDEDLTYSYDPPGPYPLGSTHVTMTVTTERDSQSDLCSAYVTVVDDTPPTLDCIDLTVQLNEFGEGGFGSDQFHTASDNCGIDEVIGDFFITCDAVGDLPIAWTVYDVNGNQSTCYITVTVEDPDDACEDTSPRGDRIAIPEIDAVPNPANETVRLTFQVPEDGKAVIELLDETGTSVKVPFNSMVEGGIDHDLELDLSTLRPGIYYYRIIAGNQQTIKKLVVLH